MLQVLAIVNAMKKSYTLLMSEGVSKTTFPGAGAEAGDAHRVICVSNVFDSIIFFVSVAKILAITSDSVTAPTSHCQPCHYSLQYDSQ